MRRLQSLLGQLAPKPVEAESKAISEYGTSKNVDPLFDLFAKYDLYKHVVELEAYGMTVVPPEKLNWSPGFADRLREAIIRTCETRNNFSLGDYQTTRLEGVKMMNLTRNSWHLLEEDEVFVEAATNPVQLALVRWLCGQSAVFGGQTWIIKGPSNPDEDGIQGSLALHSDSHGIPPGGGSIAHMCNASILCTDYEGAEDGPTVFVPGSHKYGRATLPHEKISLDGKDGFKTFPLCGKAGSLALWNGAVWHGSVPRTKDGLRITLVQNYFRTYMRTMRNYEETTSPELLKKYPELARVVGKPLYPFKNPHGPDYRGNRVGNFMDTGKDPYA